MRVHRRHVARLVKPSGNKFTAEFVLGKDNLVGWADFVNRHSGKKIRMTAKVLK